MKTDRFRVPPGKKKLDLSDWPTKVKDVYADRAGYEAMLAEHHEELKAMQRVLYAQDQRSVLLIFQGMDTAGKDGAVRHVMGGINPTGVQVFSFKKPSHEELDHDWMWRTTCRMPERGRIGIFNRSYYEELLVVRVHPEILAYQRLPAEFVDHNSIWRERARDIVHFEDYMTRNGTKILKFFLHISKDEQKERFMERIDLPEKQWKFAGADIRERAFWDDYQRAFADAVRWTSTERAPWFVVPGDDKKNARLIISRIIVDEMEKLKLEYPTPGPDHARLLAESKAKLVGESD